MKKRGLLTKKAFTRISKSQPYITTPNGSLVIATKRPLVDELSQATFLAEYYADGHKIHDRFYYPDKESQDENGNVYIEKMIRCSFSFQRMIATKHIIHLCGNDVQFELVSQNETDTQKDLFFKLRKGWHSCLSEKAMFDWVSSSKITGDGAVVGVIDKNKFSWRTYSYLKGDILYPHFNEYGKIIVFAREYESFNEDTGTTSVYVEVYDSKNYYLFINDEDIKDNYFNFEGRTLDVSGYKLLVEKKHGFPFIPVAYYRDDDGACWTPSNDAIDKWELAVSHLFQNNLAFAFPILFLKGEALEIQGGQDIYRPVKSILGDSTSSASFLDKPNGTAAFELQLKILLDSIYQDSFIVKPPELRSGDLPAAAIKLLYSPAIEQAIVDSQKMHEALNEMVKIFKFGYGLEISQQTPMSSLPVMAWIEPYIHQNIAELIDNLQKSVFAGFMSKETASERSPLSKNDELARLLEEVKRERREDLLDDLVDDNQEPIQENSPE